MGRDADVTYLGIDPGRSGGIAVLDANGRVVSVSQMPQTNRDVLDAILEHRSESWAVIERVGPSPQMGRVSVWTFGSGYGALLMALVAAGIPHDEVRPQAWQQAMGCLTGGDKNVSKRRAQQLFPRLTITHAIADALLIAEYCRRLHTGRLAPKKAR